MASDQNRIDQIIQFSLLVAGEEDDYFDRQLGPIHFIKYVYFADLWYASHNSNATFTGVEWMFHKFGPWSQAVNERIEPALAGISASKVTFESHYENGEDWFRWCKSDSTQLKHLENQLGLLGVYVRGKVRSFGKDTSRLLDEVYRTPPVLKAAPGEKLDFSLVPLFERPVAASRGNLKIDQISKGKKRKLKEGMERIQEEFQRRKSEREESKVTAISPRVDDVFLNGLNWLDSLAGEEIPEGDFIAEFDEEVWHSDSRNSEDVS